MTKCGFCNKELKVTFFCPYCKQPFCIDHRKPKDHNCSEQNKFEVLPENNDFLEISSDGSHIFEDEDNSFEEAPNKFTEPIEQLAEKGDKIYEDIDSRQEEPTDIIQDETLYSEQIKVNDFQEYEVKITEKAVNESPEYTKTTSEDYQDFLKKIENVKTPLLVIIIASLLAGTLIGMSIGPKNELLNLQQRYDALFEHYTDLEQAYNELAIQYQETETEKTALAINNSILKQELEDLLKYKKTILLEEDKLITLSPNTNQSVTYSIPFSGYITLNYSATSNISVWIGSSSLNNIFYSRIPDSPNTNTYDNITIPVFPDLVILFVNDDESETAVINFWVSFTY